MGVIAQSDKRKQRIREERGEFKFEIYILASFVHRTYLSSSHYHPPSVPQPNKRKVRVFLFSSLLFEQFSLSLYRACDLTHGESKKKKLFKYLDHTLN